MLPVRSLTKFHFRCFFDLGNFGTQACTLKA
jgi:hypothetical protein